MRVFMAGATGELVPTLRAAGPRSRPEEDALDPDPPRSQRQTLAAIEYVEGAGRVRRVRRASRVRRAVRADLAAPARPVRVHRWIY